MNMIIYWLKWRIAGRELRELERWHIEHEVLRRWLAEFPDVAEALDYMHTGAIGTSFRPNIQDVREIMRARAKLAVIQIRTRKAAAHAIIVERNRQVRREGFAPKHDDTYVNGELASAAACYATALFSGASGSPPVTWPWHAAWWKPKDHRSNLVRAGALIMAEIERIDRTSNRPDEVSPSAYARGGVVPKWWSLAGEAGPGLCDITKIPAAPEPPPAREVSSAGYETKASKIATEKWRQEHTK